MLNPDMEKALNAHLKEEMFSFYLYLSMAAHLESQHLGGMATWMKTQAKEELGHAMKFFSYIMERGGEVELEALDKPQRTWDSPASLFAAALGHERHITSRINALAEQASGLRDFATMEFLNYFVKEQVEEEASVEPIVHRLQRSGDNMAALYVLDRDLGQRA